MKGGALLERAEGALVDLNVALREMGADSETLQQVAGLYRRVRSSFDGIDWPEIRLRYEVGGVGLSELARRFGVNKTTIGMRAEREKWTRPPGFDARASKKASLVRAFARRQRVPAQQPVGARAATRRAMLLELITELAVAGERSMSQQQIAKQMKSGSVVPDLAALVADGSLSIERGGRKGVRYTVKATGQSTDWTSPPKAKAVKTARVKAAKAPRAKRPAKPKVAKPLPLLEVLPPVPPPAPARPPVTAGVSRRLEPIPPPMPQAPRRSIWSKRRDPVVVAPSAPTMADAAKRFLQQRGIVVFAADVADRPLAAIDPAAPVDMFQVDGRRLSVEDMVEKALKLGFQVRA